jgi:hypothetical protein
MKTIVTFAIEKTVKGQISQLAAITGKTEEQIMSEVVETGLKTYQAGSNKNVKAVLDLIEWAEKEQITGKENDLSIHHDKYAWGE